MANRPRILDLFCGAGGAAMGYHRAGWEVVGVDHDDQPNYPFNFVRGDALEYCARYGHLFDAIHASPPCQAFSSARHMRRKVKRSYPDLVEPTRQVLVGLGTPYIIENVPGAPLLSPVRVCGSSFGLAVRRHRLFESSELLFGTQCAHPAYSPIAVFGDHPEHHQCGRRLNRAHSLKHGQDAMGIDWMDWRSLTQAVPPAYTEFLGRQLLNAVSTPEQAEQE